MARTMMMAAMMTLRELVKSTLFSTTLRTPMAEIMPYRIMLTPPMVARGMAVTRAPNLGEKESRTARPAAMRMTRGS